MIWRNPALWHDPTARDMPKVVPEYWAAVARDQSGYGLAPVRGHRDAADRLFWPLVVSALIQGALLIMAGVLAWGMR